jgi:hypothetical protein
MAPFRFWPSAVLLSFLTLAAPAAAQTKTWTGGANDGGNWNSADNWSPSGAPSSGSNVILQPRA